MTVTDRLLTGYICEPLPGKRMKVRIRYEVGEGQSAVSEGTQYLRQTCPEFTHARFKVQLVCLQHEVRGKEAFVIVTILNNRVFLLLHKNSKTEMIRIRCSSIT